MTQDANPERVENSLDAWNERMIARQSAFTIDLNNIKPSMLIELHETECPNGVTFIEDCSCALRNQYYSIVG